MIELAGKDAAEISLESLAKVREAGVVTGAMEVVVTGGRAEESEQRDRIDLQGSQEDEGKRKER